MFSHEVIVGNAGFSQRLRTAYRARVDAAAVVDDDDSNAEPENGPLQPAGSGKRRVEGRGRTEKSLWDAEKLMRGRATRDVTTYAKAKPGAKPAFLWGDVDSAGSASSPTPFIATEFQCFGPGLVVAVRAGEVDGDSEDEPTALRADDFFVAVVG